MPEISDEMTKNQPQRNSEQTPATISRKKKNNLAMNGSTLLRFNSKADTAFRSKEALLI